MNSRVLRLLSVWGVMAVTAPAFAQLTVTDVQTVIIQAVSRASQISPNSVIAVTDREGFVLAVWVVRGGTATLDEVATAVSKAGTASFLSSNQNAFTSRTAGFIIQQHFPPGVQFTPTGPLVGVGLSNLFFSDINKFKGPGSVSSFSPTPGLTIVPVIGTSLDGSPGGVPLYKNGVLVGGVGVTGDGTPQPAIPASPSPPLPPLVRNENPFIFIGDYDVDRDVALAGQARFGPSPAITADNVFINGIRLPYVVGGGSAATSKIANSRSRKPKPPKPPKPAKPPKPPKLTLVGNEDPTYPTILGTQPTFPYPPATFGGVPAQIRQPIIN